VRPLVGDSLLQVDFFLFVGKASGTLGVLLERLVEGALLLQQTVEALGAGGEGGVDGFEGIALGERARLLMLVAGFQGVIEQRLSALQLVVEGLLGAAPLVDDSGGLLRDFLEAVAGDAGEGSVDGSVGGSDGGGGGVDAVLAAMGVAGELAPLILEVCDLARSSGVEVDGEERGNGVAVVIDAGALLLEVAELVLRRFEVGFCFV